MRFKSDVVALDHMWNSGLVMHYVLGLAWLACTC